MEHIFLSYSRRDGVLVDRLSDHLIGLGYRTWVDRTGIQGGEQWRREIVGAIKSAALFLVFLSPNSIRSENVRKELDLADEARVKILPIAIAPVDLPDGIKYQLAGRQIVELWRDPDRATDAFLRSVRGLGLQRGEPIARQPQHAPAMNETANLDLSHLGGGRFLDALGRLRLFGRKPAK